MKPGHNISPSLDPADSGTPEKRRRRLSGTPEQPGPIPSARNYAEASPGVGEERYRILFESIDEGFCIIEVLFDEQDVARDYRFLEVNPAFERQTGLSEAVGRTMRELRPEHEPHWFERYGRVARTGEDMRFEAPARALGRDYDVYAFRVGPPEQRRVAILFNDVTARKEQERQAGEQLRLLELIAAGRPLRECLEALTASIARLHPPTRACVLIANGDRTSVEGSFSMHVSPSFGEALRGVPINDLPIGTCGTAIRTGQPVTCSDIQSSGRWSQEWRDLCLAHGIRAAHSTPVFDAEGRAVASLFLCLDQPREPDAHELRIAESGARIASIAIERDRSARTIAESAERMRQSARMEAVGRLAGGLAHDFNNQLTVLRGFAGYAAADPGISAESRQDLLEVQRAADRMAELTRQLLAYSRQQQLSPQLVDLDGAIAESRKLLERLIGSHVEYRVRRGAGPKWVMADPAQLQQVLMNLCLNARDAMAEGGELSITTAVRTDPAHGGAEPSRWVELVVADTGEGIAAEHLAHIFEPFFTTKGHGSGTGLGLATVHGIVTQSGGTVSAESEPGRGTRFTVRFPLAATPGMRDAAPPVRILVVEDEEAVQSFARRALELAGYDVLTAQHGKQALELLAGDGGTVDLLLCDVMMPVMGGRELSERLAVEYPELPVVWMSGYHTDADELRWARGGARSFVQKPMAPEQLLAAVRDVLGRRVMGHGS